MEVPNQSAPVYIDPNTYRVAVQRHLLPFGFPILHHQNRSLPCSFSRFGCVSRQPSGGLNAVVQCAMDLPGGSTPFQDAPEYLLFNGMRRKRAGARLDELKIARRERAMDGSNQKGFAH